MLKKQIVRKFTLADCREYREAIKAELALTGLRLSRLLSTQDKNPKWAAYDKYADDMVGIDIRIEEQYAVYGELEEDTKVIEERIDAILKVVPVTQTPRLEEPVYQLGFFDSDKKRERMGVPC